MSSFDVGDISVKIDGGLCMCKPDASTDAVKTRNMLHQTKAKLRWSSGSRTSSRSIAAHQRERGASVFMVWRKADRQSGYFSVIRRY